MTKRTVIKKNFTIKSNNQQLPTHYEYDHIRKYDGPLSIFIKKEVSCQDFVHLMKSLKEIDIPIEFLGIEHSKKIRDDWFFYLNGVKIQKFNIVCCPHITSNAFIYIMPNKYLQEIFVQSCYGVTDYIKKILPNIEIEICNYA